MTEAQPASVCGLCNLADSDVQLLGCGCTIHARCAPVSLICEATSQTVVGGSGVPSAVQPNTVLCPMCKLSPVSGLKLFGLPLTDIDRAVEIRKSNPSSGMQTGKRSFSDTDSDFQAIQSESSYLLMSHSHSLSTGVSPENDLKRTGRWSEEEIAYVDAVLDAFDNGKLSIPQGVKLNEFLVDLLMCKSSRLTKKMKNARLGVRSYELQFSPPGSPTLDHHLLSSLQEKFIKSVSEEAAQLELRFNITKVWRTYFSNLCVQAGSSMLDVNDWVESLEQMESRASQAEETIRKARRRRMGMALKTDARSASKGVFFAGMPVKQPERKRIKSMATGESYSTSPSVTDTSCSPETDDGTVDSDLIAGMLDLGDTAQRPRAESMDFNLLFDEFPSSFVEPPCRHQHLRNNCGPFLEELVSYMESNDLPFEHVDVFVPSFTPDGQGKTEKDLLLFHAGFATRSDLDPLLFCRLNEFGEYSVKFSFASGVGLPGRVFATGQPSWERRIDEADPKYFERAGGSKVYGVKTAVGFPLATSVIGKIIVSMYSVQDIPEDADLVQKIKHDLSKYSPEPKWKLVVDMGPTDSVTTKSNGGTQNVSIAHYQHSDNALDGASTASSAFAAASTGVAMNHSTSSVTIESSPDPLEEEQRIASLLGDHMPLGELPAAGQTESQSVDSQFVPVFMSLRLLLLRAASKRSAEETEILDVIKKSFRGYAKDSRRSDKELAYLIVKDWQYLITSMVDKKPAAQPSNEYKSHVMGPPAMSTESLRGAPAAMPSSLCHVDHSDVRKTSFGGPVNSGGRRLSIDEMAARGVVVPDEQSI